MTKIALTQEQKAALTNRYPAMQRIEVKTDEKEVTRCKGDYRSVEIRSDPTDPNSPKVKLTIAMLKDSKPSKIIAWHKSVVGNVIPNLNLQSAKAKARFLEETMKEPMVSTWKRAYEAKLTGADRSNLTDNNFVIAVQNFLKTIMPHNCLSKQQRYLLFAVRKPLGMSVREYVQQLEEKNEDLTRYPPDFDESQKLPDDIIAAIRDNSWPMTWQKQAILQGHDSLRASKEENIEFFERIEETEGALASSDWTIPRKKTKTNHKPSSSNPKKRSHDEYFYNKKPKAKGTNYKKYTPEEKKAYWEKKKKQQAKNQQAMMAEAAEAAVNAVFAAQKANLSVSDDESDNESCSTINSGPSIAIPAEDDAFAASLENMEIDDKKEPAKDDDESTISAWGSGPGVVDSSLTSNSSKKSLDQVITHSLYATNVVSESHSIRSTLAGRPKKKKRKLEHNVPIVFARMRTRKGQPKPIWIRILLDSGASGCIIHKSLVKKLKQKNSKKSSWNTAAGTFQTEGTAKIDFILP